MKPNLRKDLKIFNTGDELLLYDKTTFEIHRLDEKAAFVFERCDGETPVTEIVSAAQAEWDDPDTEAIVEGTVDLLLDKKILVATGGVADPARRRMFAKTAVVVTTGITTLVAPTPAQAQSAGGVFD